VFDVEVVMFEGSLENSMKDYMKSFFGKSGALNYNFHVSLLVGKVSSREVQRKGVSYDPRGHTELESFHNEVKKTHLLLDTKVISQQKEIMAVGRKLDGNRQDVEALRNRARDLRKDLEKVSPHIITLWSFKSMYILIMAVVFIYVFK
jgi:hypothetical protein